MWRQVLQQPTKYFFWSGCNGHSSCATQLRIGLQNQLLKMPSYACIFYILVRIAIQTWHSNSYGHFETHYPNCRNHLCCPCLNGHLKWHSKSTKIFISPSFANTPVIHHPISNHAWIKAFFQWINSQLHKPPNCHPLHSYGVTTLSLHVQHSHTFSIKHGDFHLSKWIRHQTLPLNSTHTLHLSPLKHNPITNFPIKPSTPRLKVKFVNVRDLTFKICSWAVDNLALYMQYGRFLHYTFRISFYMRNNGW